MFHAEFIEEWFERERRVSEYINVSRRNDDLPLLIEKYSEQFNLSKADTVAEILRAYPKLIAYKQKVMEEESRSFGRLLSNAV